MRLNVIVQNLPYFFGGLMTTIEVAFFGAVAGLAIAVATAAIRHGGGRVVSLPFTAYVEVFRNTPLLVQALILFFGPTEFGFRFDGFQTLAICLALNSGAYMSEIIRGGVESIARGQVDAGKAIGLSFVQRLRHVIVPQALRRILPAWVNTAVEIVKPGGTGTPAFDISASPAPLPPSTSRMRAFPSARPSPKK